ncbi:MAG: hypothetical protein V3V97_04710 [Hyphomicrobiaceae bacterium]
MLEREIRRRKALEWLAQFFQLIGGAMDLEAGNVRNLQGFIQELTNIVQMREKALGISIALSTMGLVTIEAKAVVQTFVFTCGFFDKRRATSLEVVEFAFMNLEIRNKRNAGVLCRHHYLPIQSCSGALSALGTLAQMVPGPKEIGKAFILKRPACTGM